MPHPSPTDWTELGDEDLTAEAIHDALDPVKDDLWVAAACVDRLSNDTTVQRVLLEMGLERTNMAKNRSQAASTDGGDAILSYFQELPADARLCAIRAVILLRLDRLNTYVEICKAAPDDMQGPKDAWEDDDPWVEAKQTATLAEPPIPLVSFLTDPLLRSTRLLASYEWFAAVKIIFDRHTTQLWPHRFVVLESIPEHANPSSYRELLPALDSSTNNEKFLEANLWRQNLDWVEQQEVKTVLADLNFSSPEAEDVTHSCRADPTTADELEAWYKNRIELVLETSGMVDVALELVQHAASQGIPSLDELGEDLSLLSRLIYDVTQDGNDVEADWTLERWHSLHPLAVVRAYLQYSTPSTVVQDLWRLVMPYLFVVESRAERAGDLNSDIRNRVLYDYILGVPLDIAAAIFEASKPILPQAQRIIQNNEDMARLALACLYGSDSLDEWSVMNSIFECLPAWDVNKDDNDEDAADMTVVSLGQYVTPSTTRPHCTASDLFIFFRPLPLTSLSRALDILDVHLESGEILSRWSVAAPLRWFLQSNSNVPEQRRWANRLARRGSTDDKLTSLEDWEWLLEDMLKLTSQGENGLRGAFGLLSQDEILRIFFSGLLNNGNFSIAKTLLRSRKTKISLSAQSIEDLCLSCSRELYDNANSGNFTFGDMKLAYECLDVPPLSERLQQEKEFIEATSRLSSFNIMSSRGTPLTPIEIRLTKDRLSLVSRVLSSNNDAYKHTQVILDLVRKLGLGNDVVAEVKTLAMLADTALQAEDFVRAYEASQQMIDTVLNLRSMHPDSRETQEASEVCWVACFQLGRQPEFDDMEKKLGLLGRALEICPPEQLHDILAAWRRLENEDLDSRKERLSSHQDLKANGRPKSRGIVPSLAERLQEFHLPSPQLLNTPDAAALASRTFRSVAANFPFGINRPQSVSQEDERASSRLLSKGIGWLIGADDED
ncbi:Sec39 domain-containing protein [Mycena indigotica]|uniref:Sec39 domain-containing protein n=1 Tax=Mycena indigotica TaxID=2126181 RepID=A0A8H6SXW1_9AGAR|nr:Sec39 domain-containing protein [Mycena indigotica]KAF7306802.1 Sec39 domain-containing protein [Mycena indigotica]